MISFEFTEDGLKKVRDKFNDEFAQKPSIQDRKIKIQDETSVYDILGNRNEFSIDRDRILFSKAFRRLEHKAQIYSHEKGDHFRTRLTHTLEVVQIARSISRNLGLNEDLTEAIALGHDIGHTPFGHQGEFVLDSIMCGEDNLGGKLKYNINFRGFKHNFHSLRILDILEKKFEDEIGLNLTWQTLDGILKHTKIEKPEKTWDIKRFMQKSNQRRLIEKFITEKIPVTLEGQVVAIADEIAQRQHDLDDGLRDKSLKLNEGKIIEYVQNILSSEIAKWAVETFKTKEPNFESNSISEFANNVLKSIFNPEIVLLEELESKIKKREIKRFDTKILGKKIDDLTDYLNSNNYSEKDINLLKNLKSKFADENDSDEWKIVKEEEIRNHEYIWNALVSDIIDYFIKDVTLKSLEKIDEYGRESKEEYQGKIYFTEKLINFSENGEKIDKKIKNYIDDRIVNSYDVNRFDGKATFIIKQIFKAYYNNPRQMPKILLEILSTRIKANSVKYDCRINLGKEFADNIKFKTSSPRDIDKLVDLLKLNISTDEMKDLEVIIGVNNKRKISEFRLDEEFLILIGGKDIKEFKKCRTCNKNNYEIFLLSKIFNSMNEYEDNILDRHRRIESEKYEEMLFVKTLIENHYAFLSVICDHIAGMTDNFANEEYEKLYLV